MRTGAARGHVGHFHEAGFYGSDAEFAALIVPFAEEGIAAGKPVILGYDDRKNALVRPWLTDPSAVTFIGDESLYATPARAIATYRRLFEFRAAIGAGQIRIAGDVPHPGNGGWFEGWDRYESAVNTVWQDFPVWGRCLYDTAIAPPAVLDVAERTHPVSSRRRDSAGPATATKAPWYSKASSTHPIRSKPPRLLLNRSTDPPPKPGTRSRRSAPAAHPAATLDDLLIGVSEAVTNAQRHGRPPATVRIWPYWAASWSPFTTQAAAQPTAWQA